MRSIIFTVGLPGSGKTTLAKALSNMFGYFHFEYDLYVMDKNHYKNTHENDKIIIDAWYRNGSDLLQGLTQAKEEFNYENITVIYLKTPKEKCINRIKTRNRSTVDITNETSNYNFDEISKYINFDLIVIEDF